MTQDEFLTKMGTPKKYMNARLSDAPKEIGLKTDQSYFLFSDETGTGKTHLAWAILNEIRLADYVNGRNRNIAFTTIGNLLSELRDSIKGRGKSELEIVNEFQEMDVLALDDLGGIRSNEASDYSVSSLFEILDYRWNWELQTIFTSNKSLEQLAETFDRRISSRIAGMCKPNIIQLNGKDKRILFVMGKTSQKNGYVGQKQMPLRQVDHDNKWRELTAKENSKGYGYKLPWPNEQELKKEIADSGRRKVEAEAEEKRLREERERKQEEWKRKKEEIERIAKEKRVIELSPENLEVTRQKLLKQAEEYTAQQSIQKPPEADNEQRKK
jgi:hypothetical protein